MASPTQGMREQAASMLAGPLLLLLAAPPGAHGGTAPALCGKGVVIGDDAGSVEGLERICDFAIDTADAFSITIAAISTIAPSASRDDVVAWLAEPSAAALPPLLKGATRPMGGINRPGVACVNEGGLSMDDVDVLVALAALARDAGTDGWPEASLSYIRDSPCAWLL